MSPRVDQKLRVTCQVYQLISTVSRVQAGQGSSIPQHLRATKKILQGVFFNTKYVWSIKIRRVGGLILKFAGSRGTMDAAEVKRTNEIDVRIATDM